MDKLEPEVRVALFAIQKDLLMNVSVHQYIVSELQKGPDEFTRMKYLMHKSVAEENIKVLDQRQKKFLADIRSNNLEKQSVTQKKEEKPVASFQKLFDHLTKKPTEEGLSAKPEKLLMSPQKLIDYPAKRLIEEDLSAKPEILLTSPQKLINYPAKRPLEEDSSTIPVKKKKVDRKTRLFGMKTEETPENERNNCFSEEEEERLRAYGCFYVFSKQEKLTRPLTEQDYFLMNFGLVSRDHIQYAPYDVSRNVRRTRRQLRSKPKYQASEWDTTHAGPKKPKPCKGKIKEENPTIPGEASSAQIGNKPSIFSKSKSSQDVATTEASSSKESSEPSDCASKSIKKEEISDSQTPRLGTAPVSAPVTAPVSARTELKVEPSEAPVAKQNLSTPKIEPGSKRKKEAKPAKSSTETRAMAAAKTEMLDIKGIVPKASNKKVLDEVTGTFIEESELQKLRLERRLALEESRTLSKILKSQEKLPKGSPEKVLDEVTGALIVKSREVTAKTRLKLEESQTDAEKPSAEKNPLFPCDSLENSDFAASEGISSQDSGISIRSDLSETDILLNSCSSIGFSSTNKQGHLVSNERKLLDPSIQRPTATL